MSILYCEYCHEYIDEDFNVEHFLPTGECEEETIEKLKDEGKTDEEIIHILEEIE